MPIAKANENSEWRQRRLVSAMNMGEFQLYYQPCIPVHSDLPIWMEALTRCESMGYTETSPAPMLSGHPQKSVRDQYFRWVFRRAMNDTSWFLATGNKVKVSFNANMDSMTHEIADWIENISNVERGQLDSMILEVTEEDTGPVTDEQIEVLQRLKSMGVQLAIDDYGVMSSNIERLNLLHWDVVKLDRLHLSNHEKQHRSLNEIVESVKHVDATVVVEGVESLEHYTAAIHSGADYLQGFYLSSPQPLGQATSWLKRYFTNGFPC